MKLLCTSAIVLTFCPLALPVFGAPAPQNDKANQQQSNTTKANAKTNTSGKGMQGQRAQNSFAANDLLESTDLARGAITVRDKAEAQRHIEHAQEQVMELMGKVSNNQVPIYAELSEYSVLGPIVQARQNQSGQSNSATNQQAQSAKSNNNAADGGRNSAERSQSNTATNQQSNTATKNQQSADRTQQNAPVQAVIGEYTDVTLDLQAAKEHLQAAKQALDRGEFDKADEALMAVENGVTVTTVSANLPLLRARQNLMVARRAAEQNDAAAARTALKEASDALNTFQSANQKSDLSKVRGEIDQLAQSKEALPSNAVDKIDGWWDQVTNAIPQG